MGKYLDLGGHKYGRLTVVSKGKGKRYGRSLTSVVTWHCICECGTEVEVTANGLKSGVSKSCGCLRKENLKTANTTHNRTKDPITGKVSKEYRTWQNMKARCENPNHRHYHLYGGRGINVCDRWQSFAAFFEDMGSPPTDRHSIDRIDNDSAYTPENCRWATQRDQINNRKNTVFIEYNGERLPSSEWSARTGVPIKSIYVRLRLGWPVERALFEMPKKRARAKCKVGSA